MSYTPVFFNYADPEPGLSLTDEDGELLARGYYFLDADDEPVGPFITATRAAAAAARTEVTT